jgi:uncharacterized GH25 family protein
MRLLLAAALAAPALAAAHDLWIEPEGGAFVVRYGHRGGEILPVQADQLKGIRCAEGTGAPRDVASAARFAPKEARFPGPCAVASVVSDGGFWSLTPDGEVNLPRTRAKDPVKSWASRQYAKWVDARSPRAREPMGDELELVPVSDLAKARQGDKITLRVLSGGGPVPDAVVAIDHKPIGETDSKGEVRIRLRRPGVETLSATLRRPHRTPEADADVLEASLTFEVAR